MGFCGEESFTVWNQGDFSKCFEDSVIMTLPGVFLLVFGLKLLYDLETKKPDVFHFKQLVHDFRHWKRSVQLEVIVSILLVAWKVLFFIVDVSIYSEPYVKFYSTVTMAQWIVAFFLVYLELKKGQPRSWNIRVYWVLAFLCAVVKLRTLSLGAFDSSYKLEVSFLEYFSFLIGFILVLILSITSVLFFDYSGAAYTNLDENEEPLEKNANLFSKITFWWINPILVKGYKKSLDIPDVPKLTDMDQSEILSQKFEKAWEYQLTQPKPSLPRALAAAFGPHFYVAAIFKLVQDGLMFVGPILLGKVIQFVTTQNVPTYNGLIYVLFYFLSPVIQSLTLHQYFHRCFRVGMWLRSAVVTAVYKKALRTSLREGTTIGEIVNLMSVDAQKFMDLCPYLHMIWSALEQIAIALILLYLKLGPAVFAGLGIMLVMIPVNLFISNLAKKRQTVSMKLKDKRTKAVNEVLNGIKVIKLYSWEQSFMNHVNSIRNMELDVMKVIKYIQGFSLLLWSMSPIFVSVTTFAVYILTNGVLTAAIAFPCLSLFNVMQFPINMLPNVVSSIIEASVSVQRLERFLLKKDLDPHVVDRHISEAGVAIKLENASLEWEPGKTVLKNINLEVKEKELIAIVGHVGSGKSSLISSLVGDLDKTKGTVAVKGSVALVTQQAWIQNATLKNNILFSKELNEEKYQKVIEACCLLPDLKILPAGDQTEIGEKGINLSGGQKQRVSIARAVYNNADIYLFDDPLSAVDAHVGKSIFRDVLSNTTGMLRNKTRVLVTHAVHYLPYVDRIIMIKDGAIAEEGTFDFLMQNEGPFASLMKHDSNNQQQIPTPNTASLSSSAELINDDNKEQTPQQQGQSKTLEEEFEEEDLGESDKLIDVPRKVIIDQPTQVEEDSSNNNNAILTTNGGIESEEEEDDEEQKELMEDIDIETNDQDSLKPTDGEKKKSLFKKPLGILKTINNTINKPAISALPPTEQKTTTANKEGKIISVETRQEGKVSLKVYFAYFQAIGPLLAVLIIGFYVVTQLFSILANWWLSNWTNSVGDNGEDSKGRDSKYYLSIYVAFSFAAIGATLFRSFSMVFGSIKGSKLFHEKMFKAVIRSPMSFFDTTPIGRILNRFSKDQLTIDESIARTLGMFLNTFCQVFGSIIVIALVSPFIIIAMIPVAALFYFIQRYYLNSSRELTRLEGVSRSPIYAHFSETLAGVTTIRAFQEAFRFSSENEKLLDDNQKCYYINISANRWLALRLEFLGACIVTSTVLYTVLASHHIDPGTAGLVITYALAITSNMNWMVRMSCDLENSVVSIERIQEYCSLPSEAALTNDKKVPKGWPTEGKIVFKNLWLAYREGLDPVLRGISLTIEPKQKIGIVGRTGAGKSSLTQALFRLVEPLRGTIEIDGIDIRDLGLHTLRSRISIIPQDPVLFAGTIRSNLDPFNKYRL